MDAPSRKEVIEKFRLLIQESESREDVASWAQKWVIADHPADMDDAIWEALSFLSMTDLISTDRPYLFMVEDFERELATLLRTVKRRDSLSQE